MAVIVPVVSKFDPKGFNKAKSGFASLGKSLKSSLGAIGVATSLAGVVGQLNAMGKAAVADAKSQALLANAMKNTLNASQGQIASTEASIQKFSSLYSVLDDQIRPAMSQFVRITGDAAKATELTDLALNVAAGTGRDLSSVTIALSKAYQGNTTSLARLGINVKGLKDPMAALAKQFDGAAEAAANVDPYKRIEVALDNAQETIGAALIPAMNELADLLTSDAFKVSIDAIATDFGDFVLGLIEVSNQIDTTIKDINTAISGLGLGVDLSFFENIIARLIPGFNILRGIIGIGRASRESKTGTGQGGSVIENYRAQVAATDAANARAEAEREAARKRNEAARRAAKAAADAAKRIAKETAEAAKKAAQEVAEALAKETEALAEFSKELMALGKSVKPLIALGREIGQFEQSTVDSFDAIAKSIQEGIGNGTIIARAGKNLLDYVATERKALTAIAQQRDELASKRGLAEALIGDVKAAVVGFASITDLVNKETGNLTSNFADVVSKTKAFASQLKQLRELGLDKNLYKQIVDAGIDAGGATAAEIIAGGAGTVSELNNLFSELEKAGAAIAEDTALVMFNNGVEVAGGLVAGLMSQEQALVNAATALADAFTSTFNSMITNLKVPSQEVEQITLSIADIARGNTGIAGANSAVSRGLANRYLNATAGQGAQTITITVNAGLGTNGKAVGQAIQAELNKYNRSNLATV